MLPRFVTTCIAIFGLVAIVATPAKASILTDATTTATCQDYNLTVNATDLMVGATYTIDYRFTVTYGGGSPITIANSTTFIASASTEAVTASGSFNATASGGNCTVTGSATLTSSGSTVDIIINNMGTTATLSSSALTLSCPASAAQVGVPYNSFVVASGGFAPYIFQGISGGVPGICCLNTSTGL